MLLLRSLLALCLLVLGLGASSPLKVVKLPLQAQQDEHPLSKRQNEVPLPNQYAGFSYWVNLTFGSDNQTVPVLFDTGSEILWVNPNCSKAQEPAKQKCFSSPRYSPFTSKTSKIVNEALNITYGTGSTLGVFFTDDIKIGSATIKNQQFGVAVDSRDCYMGLLGASPGRNRSHHTFIESLAAQNQINSLAFSLDLRSLNETGSVIFGGIDTKKYKCGLEKLPARGYHIKLIGIGQTFPNRSTTTYPSTLWNKGNSSDGVSLLIDTGTAWNLLPNDLYFAVGQDYPGAKMIFDKNHVPIITVPCEAPEGTFDFTFGTKTIKVSYKDMVVNNFGRCELSFGIGPDDPSRVPYLLGDPFLRGTYIVFDVENKNIWVGESDNCGSNIVAIGKGKDAVPVIAGCGCDEPASSTVAYAVPSAMASTF